MTKKDVLRLLRLIVQHYPSSEAVSQERIDLWYQSLKKCPSEQVFAKYEQYVKNSPYPPKISDVYVRRVSENPYHGINKEIEVWKKNAATAEEISKIVASVKWR